MSIQSTAVCAERIQRYITPLVWTSKEHSPQESVPGMQSVWRRQAISLKINAIADLKWGKQNPCIWWHKKVCGRISETRSGPFACKLRFCKCGRQTISQDCDWKRPAAERVKKAVEALLASHMVWIYNDIGDGAWHRTVVFCHRRLLLLKSKMSTWQARDASFVTIYMHCFRCLSINKIPYSLAVSRLAGIAFSAWDLTLSIQIAKHRLIFLVVLNCVAYEAIPSSIKN